MNSSSYLNRVSDEKKRKMRNEEIQCSNPNCQRLAICVQELESEVARLKQQEASSSKGMKKPIDPELIAEKDERKQQMIAKAIKKSMIWKPSCKTGSAKWSWEGECDFTELLAIFGFPSNTPFKTKRISLSDFERAVGPIHASARYSSLEIRGEHVNLHFDADTNTMRLSGSYGV